MQCQGIPLEDKKVRNSVRGGVAESKGRKMICAYKLGLAGLGPLMSFWVKNVDKELFKNAQKALDIYLKQYGENLL